jgi:hypothetical protein
MLDDPSAETTTSTPLRGKCQIRGERTDRQEFWETKTGKKLKCSQPLLDESLVSIVLRRHVKVQKAREVLKVIQSGVDEISVVVALKNLYKKLLCVPAGARRLAPRRVSES